MSRYYLAGPMTGLPQFNFPAFHAAATALRRMGMDVISPHEQDKPMAQLLAWASPDGKLTEEMIAAGGSWGEVLGRDVRIVADQVDGIILLDGWERSRGARLEVFVGLLTGKTFQRIARGDYLCPQYSREFIQQTIRENMP